MSLQPQGPDKTLSQCNGARLNPSWKHRDCSLKMQHTHGAAENLNTSDQAWNQLLALHSQCVQRERAASKVPKPKHCGMG